MILAQSEQSCGLDGIKHLKYEGTYRAVVYKNHWSDSEGICFLLTHHLNSSSFGFTYHSTHLPVI